MPILLILLVATIIELAVLVVVGKAIGVLATIGLLILASLVGAALLRREGIRTLVAFQEAVSTRRPPHRELIDGMLIAAAGVFIVLPGFVSDVLGLLLLLPPTRALVRRRMLHTTGLHTTGLHTTGLHTTGLHTTGLHTTGLHTTGLHTTGLHTTGLHTPVHFTPGAVVEGEVIDEPLTPRTGHEPR